MAQCETIGCTKEGTIERDICTPFSMTSTASQSKRKIVICVDCHNQDMRMKLVGRPAGLGRV